MPNGEEKPVAFASRTSTSSEQNYAQIEKKALALVFGVKKFCMVGSSHCLLITDHSQPFWDQRKASLPLQQRDFNAGQFNWQHTPTRSNSSLRTTTAMRMRCLVYHLKTQVEVLHYSKRVQRSSNHGSSSFIHSRGTC